MAQKVTTTFVDDLDGKEIAEGAGGPVEFAYDGKAYTLDLSDTNKAKLEKALASFIEKATPVRKSNGNGNGKSRSASRNDATAVREWAKGKGMEVSERGRISKEVQEAYDADK